MLVRVHLDLPHGGWCLRVCVCRLLSVLRSAQRTLDVCVFTITCDEIADALLQAHQRGVRVRIISDNDQVGWWVCFWGGALHGVLAIAVQVLVMQAHLQGVRVRIISDNDQVGLWLVGWVGGSVGFALEGTLHVQAAGRQGTHHQRQRPGLLVAGWVGGWVGGF